MSNNQEFIENNNEHYKLLKDDEDYDNVIINNRSEHDSLVKKLSKKYSSQKDPQWKSKRTEAKNQVEKYGISKNKKTNSVTDKLLDLLNDQQSKKSFKKLNKKKAILQPLLEPVAKKIARQVNFKEINKEIAKYDPIVKEIRHAEQLVFPAEDEKLKFNISDIVSNRNNEEIQKEIDGDLNNIEVNEKFLTENEMQLLKALDIEEARKLHQNIQRRRILLSYQEAKFRRIRKIKSKKYHRILKRDKLKKTMEDFNKLIEENSDKALEKLEELDKLRALERASLKHLNTGKWAKHNKIRAKMDEQTREKLNEQLKINQLLLKKPTKSVLDNETDDFEIVENNKNDRNSKEENPEFIKVPYNYNPWESSKPKKLIKVFVNQNEPEISSDEKSESIEKFISKRISQRIQDSKLEEKKQLFLKDQEDVKIIEEKNKKDMGKTMDNNEAIINNVFNNETSNDDDDDEQQTEKIQNLNPQSLINNIDDLKNLIKINNNNNDDDNQIDEDDFDVDDVDFNDQNCKNYLREAFAENDVIEEFLKEKKQNESCKIEPKNVHLPGFGSWAGFGIKESKKQKLKENNKLLRKQKRIDTKICNAIILENFDKPTGSKTFKPQIIKPIGSMWTPQTINKTLTEPKILVKSGSIIEPINPLID